MKRWVFRIYKIRWLLILLRKNWALCVGVSLGIVGLLILISILISIPFNHNIFHWFTKPNLVTASNLGQFIGGLVGVFLSGAAFLLIYSTFQEQKKFNKQQDKFNRNITKLTNKQQFETSFFNLLSTYRNLIETISGDVVINLMREKEKRTGYDYFSSVLSHIKMCDLEDSVRIVEYNLDIPEVNEVTEKIKKFEKDIIMRELCFSEDFTKRGLENLSQEYYIAIYEYHYRLYQNRLGHYFRFIHNMIKFCIVEWNNDKDRKKYIDIIQAQMSNDELGLLFYNALSRYGCTSDGEKRFYNWLNYFDFFQNVDEKSLLFRNHHTYYSTGFKFLTTKEKEVKTINYPKPDLILPT
ncbi:MAG: putative phage abortive infection protein [Bacteroidales bacterium]|jgi:hypothetical protein